MGNSPSAVRDDNYSNVDRRPHGHYTVSGPLHASRISADYINARVIYANRITTRKAQISAQVQENQPPQQQPLPPQREVSVRTLNADAIYAGT